MSLFNTDPREHVNKDLVDSAFRDIKGKLSNTYGEDFALQHLISSAVHRYMLNKAEQKIIMDHFMGGDQMKREPIKKEKLEPDYSMMGKQAEVIHGDYELLTKDHFHTGQYVRAVIVGFTDYHVIVKTSFDGKLREVKKEWLKLL